MIEIIPAIDIIDGKCVRLTKGDYTQKTVYGDNPVDIAVEFERLGFKRLHVVDLDGAKDKHVVNTDTLKRITEATSLKVDFGGGIRSDEDINAAFDNGASMVTVGSVAITRPALFIKWLGLFGADKIILGADTRGGKISINGWKEDSGVELTPFLRRYVAGGVRNVLCTDISKDGTLSGPNTRLYKRTMEAYPLINLIASGGMSCVEDIDELEKAGVPSVVLGKAIYEERINLNQLAQRT